MTAGLDWLRRSWKWLLGAGLAVAFAVAMGSRTLAALLRLQDGRTDGKLDKLRREAEEATTTAREAKARAEVLREAEQREAAESAGRAATIQALDVDGVAAEFQRIHNERKRET